MRKTSSWSRAKSIKKIHAPDHYEEDYTTQARQIRHAKSYDCTVLGVPLILCFGGISSGNDTSSSSSNSDGGIKNSGISSSGSSN